MDGTHRIRWLTLHQMLEHGKTELDGFKLGEVVQKRSSGRIHLQHSDGTQLVVRFKRDEPIEYNLWAQDFKTFVEDADDDGCCGHEDGWITLSKAKDVPRKMELTLNIEERSAFKASEQLLLTLDGMCFTALADSSSDVEWSSDDEEEEPPLWARRVVKHALDGFYGQQSKKDST